MAKRSSIYRKKTHSSFETFIYWLGMTVVLTFIAWTVIMVLMQAFTRHTH